MGCDNGKPCDYNGMVYTMMGNEQESK